MSFPLLHWQGLAEDSCQMGSARRFTGQPRDLAGTAGLYTLQSIVVLSHELVKCAESFHTAQTGRAGTVLIGSSEAFSQLLSGDSAL